ncbi:MAG: transporter substrate-binding domain-containing protein [Campylobacterota bacterium]|nr:transporter substrate-binding domain-containing protein [Campylobacterota bacterium]
MSNKISNNLGLTKEEELYLKKKNKITMCVDPDWMPFEKIQNGEHIGLASDFVKLISKKINTPINLVETSSWSESIEKAKNRECDIFSMASITPERKKYMNFTSPYLSTQIVIATKTSEIYLNDLDGSLDKIFGVVKGYSLHETLKNNYPNIKLVEVDSLNDGLEKVLEGKIFGYLDNSMVIMYAIQKKFLGTVSIVGKINKEIEYRVHTRNDEKILNEIFEKAVLSITTDEKQKIENKWLRFE